MSDEEAKHIWCNVADLLPQDKELRERDSNIVVMRARLQTTIDMETDLSQATQRTEYQALLEKYSKAKADISRLEECLAAAHQSLDKGM